MKATRAGDGERSLAVFIDFENMGLGFNNRRDRFEIAKVLERLVEKGKIVCKKAYADWSRFGGYTGALHEAAIELIEIPRRGVTGKNSADIRLVVDAIDLAYSKDHIDTFVIVSGDSDFSPLVSKLKELGKHVIGLGLSDATSDLLRDNCDEFIYYEDLDRAPIIPVAVNEQFPEKKRKVFSLLLDTLLALRRENKEVIYSSMLKDTIKRKKPSFNEGYFGYRTFSELLEDAEREGLLELEKHKTSGMYVVTRFGLELKSGPVPLPPRRAEGPKPIAPPERRVVQLPPPVAPQPPRVVQLPAAPQQPRVAQLPQPPAAPPPAVQKPQPAPPAPRPVAPPPPAAPKPAAKPKPVDDDLPLGRALMEDFDELDEDSPLEVPSYGVPKPPVKPAAKPTKPAAKEPKPAPAAKGAKPAGQKPAPARDQKPAAKEPKPAAAKPAPARDQKPPAKPKPAPPLDDDDFGAGLDV